MLAFTGDVQPSVHTGNEPLQIVVELPRTTFSADFLQTVSWDSRTQSGEQTVTGVPNVNKLYYGLFEPDAATLRIVIALSADTKYTSYIEEDAASRLLVVDLSSATAELPPAEPVQPGNGKKTVVIDAGHGGRTRERSALRRSWRKISTLA